MKATERKKMLSEAMAKASISFTDEEAAIMDRYRLSPDDKIWIVLPVYDASGRRDISDEERARIEVLKNKLKIQAIVFLMAGDERL